MRRVFFTAVFAVLLTSCAVSTTTLVPDPNNPISSFFLREAAKFDPVNVESIAPYISSGKYVQRANNLFILFDASASTTEDYKGKESFKATNTKNIRTKLEVQREIVHRMNKTLAISAPELKLQDFTIGMRSIGLGDCNGYGDRYSDLHLAPTLYAQETFDKAVDSIACSHGRSNIGRILVKDKDTLNPISELLNNERDKTVSDDLDVTKGNISLVIISDLSKGPVKSFLTSMVPQGLTPYFNEHDEKEIKDLRAKYGNRLCVYNVWMNSANKSKEEEDSTESETFSIEELIYSADNPPDCGSPSAFTAERVGEVDGMKKFMREVLLSPTPAAIKPPVSTDCSQLDSDGDGVNNCDDRCPNSLPGTPVNKLGCWIVDIKFDNDSSEIKAQYFAKLDNLAADIDAHFSNLKLEVQGHTSSTASAAYNTRLSMRRAEAVAKYLNKRIKGTHKLIPHGYGLSRPIDTNETEAGRANNRRVQLEVLP